MKLKNNMKRIISIVFAVVMTVGVGTAIFLSTGINAKAAVSSVSDDRTFSTVYFNVPETIYLAPGGTAFEYVLDQSMNTSTGAITINTGSKSISSGGNIGFYCSTMDTSVTPTLTCSASSATFGAFTKNGNVYTTTVTAGSASSGVITWTVSYKDKTDGLTKSVKAYTYCYAPYTGTVACEVARKRCGTWVGSGDRAMSNGTVWITGIHTMTSNSGGTGDYQGAFNHTPLTETFYIGSTEATIKSQNAGKASTTSCGNNNKDPEKSDFQYTTGSGWIGYWQKSEDSGTSTYTSNYNAGITVDKFRFTNLNQIPNLIGGVDIQEQWDANEKNVGTVTLTIGSTNLITTTSDNAPSKKQNWQGYRFANYLNYSISSFPASVVLQATITARVATSVPKVNLSITYTDKSSLRSTLATARKASFDKSLYSDSVVDTFYTRLQEATSALGNPTATQTEVDTAKTNLTNAVNAFNSANFKKSTATAEYYSTDNGVTTEIDNSLTSSFVKSLEYKYGDKVTCTADPVNGFDFNSKIEAFNGSTKVAETTSNSLTVNYVNFPNIKFKIYYKPKTYTATLDINKPNSSDVVVATGDTSVTNCKPNQVMPRSITPPQIKGYNFTGYWSTKTDESGVKYYDESGNPTAEVVKFTSDTTLYAHWAKKQWYADLNWYLDGVSYNNNPKVATADVYINGVSKANDVTDYWTQWLYGDKFEIKDVKPVKGYSYTGVHSNNCTDPHNDKANPYGYIPAEANCSIYLDIVTNKYNLVFDNNGKTVTTSGTASLENVKFNDAVSKISVPSLTGYTFDGFYTHKSGGTQVFDNSGNLVTNTWTLDPGYDSFDTVSYNGEYKAAYPGTNGATITLYAHWTANNYTVTYNGNGNDGGATANSSHTYDVEKALNANGFTKTGYSFAGWATSAGGNVVYANKAAVKNLTTVNGGTVTLYAKWTINQYTLAVNWDYTDASGIKNGFDPTGIADLTVVINGVTTASNITEYVAKHNYGTSFKVDGRVLDPDKYTFYMNNGSNIFKTWSYGSNIPAERTDLNFHIRPVYNVVISLGDTPESRADAFAGAKTYTRVCFGTTVTVPTGTPTRAGYTFAGWVDRNGSPVAGGSPVTIKPGTDLAPGGDYIIKATWTAKNNYTVTFDEQMIDDSGKILTPYNLFDSISGQTKEENGITWFYHKSYDANYYYVSGTYVQNGKLKSGLDVDDDDVDEEFFKTTIWNANDYIFSATNYYGNSDETSFWLYLKNGSTTYVKQRISKNKAFEDPYFAIDLSTASGTLGTSGSSYAAYPKTNSTITFSFFANNDEGKSPAYSMNLALYHGITGVTYDSKPKSVKVPSWTDHVFSGYYTEPNGKGTQYYDENGNATRAWHEDKEETVLYACWRNKSVFFDVNGVLDNVKMDNISGLGTIDVCIKQDGQSDYTEEGITDFWKDFPWGAEFTVSNLEQMTGKTYEGYRVDYGNETGEFVPAVSVDGEFNPIIGKTTSKGTTSIYLYFHTNHYKVIYNAGDDNATGGPEPDNFKYGDNNALKDGKAFKNDYEITFEYNGASVDNLPKTATVSCKFLGWSDSEIDSSVKYKAGKLDRDLTDADEEEITLYAVWSKGSITLPSPAKLGYTFEGWYEDEGLTVPAEDEKDKNHGADSYTPSGSYKLYAKWKKVIANNIYIPYDFTSDNMADVIIIRHFLDDNDTFLKDSVKKDGNETIGSVRLGTDVKSGRTLGTSTTDSSLTKRDEKIDNSSYKVELSGKNSKSRYSKEDAVLKISIKSLTVSQKLYYEYHYADNGYNQYIGGEIILVPANSVYYDEKQFDYSGSSIGTEPDNAAEWTAVEAKGDGKPTEEKDMPYGYMGQSNKYNAQSFSNGKAMRVSVNAANQVSKTAEYTYTGKGFDLYSACGNENAVLMVYVWAKDGDDYIPVANSAVDTYMETDMIIQKPGQKLLRQVPVYHFTTEETGTYLVQVYALWMEELAQSSNGNMLTKSAVANEIESLGLKVDENLFNLQWVDENSVFNGGTGSAELKSENEGKSSLNKSAAKPATLYGYIDGVRVYNPAETSGTYANGYDACYNKDEKNASFYNIKQFTRAGDDIKEYTGYSINADVSSPVNEVYLAGGGKTAIKIDGYKPGITVMISMRAVTGDAKVTAYSNKGRPQGKNFDVKSGTEMYFDISDQVSSDGTIFIENGPENTVALCNVKIAPGSVVGDVQPSLATLSVTELQNAMLFMSKSTSPCENEYSYTSPCVVSVALANNVPDPEPENPGTGDESGTGEDEPTQPTDPTVKYNLPDLREQSAGYGSRVTVSVPVKNLPAGCIVKIDGTEVPVVDGYASKGLGQLKGNKTFTVQVLSGGKVISEKQGTVKVASGFFDKLVAIIRFIFSFFKWKEAIIKF